MSSESITGGALEGVPVTITGATGFIGGRLAERLAAEEGARVTGTGRSLEKARRLEEEGVSLVEADLLDPEAVRASVEGAGLVFHVAAWLGGDESMAHPVNVLGTEHVVRAAIETGVRRVVHVSTVGAYDMDPDMTVVDESTPLAVDSPIPYSATKAKAEVRARELAGEMPAGEPPAGERPGGEELRGARPAGVEGPAGGGRPELVIARPAMVYGPRSSFWSEGICRATCEGKPVLIGDGSGHFHPIYVDNLVDALLLCAVRDEAAGEAFNVVEEPVTWREYVGGYAELCDVEPSALPLWLARVMALASRIPAVELPIDRERLLMATNRIAFGTEKIRDLLGWTPRVPLEEGLERTGRWLRAEGIV